MTGFNNAAASFGSSRHDHRHCIESALANAAQICARRGARLTALRQRVLERVWRSHRPVGAYEILRALSRDQGPERGPVAPPTVYRALEFLLAHGLVHRIESLNAYVGCAHPDGSHGGQFLICSGCGAAAEVHDPRVDAAIARRAEELGFVARRRTVEIEGLCPSCRPAESARGTDHAE